MVEVEAGILEEGVMCLLVMNGSGQLGGREEMLKNEETGQTVVQYRPVPEFVRCGWEVAVEFLSSLQFSGVVLNPITVLPLRTASRLGPIHVRSSPLFTCETSHFVNTTCSTKSYTHQFCKKLILPSLSLGYSCIFLLCF